MKSCQHLRWSESGISCSNRRARHALTHTDHLMWLALLARVVLLTCLSGVRVADPSRAAGSSGVLGSSGSAGLSPSGDAAVDAVGDAGYYARYGETAPPPRGAHAGVDLGHRRVSGV